jgi:transcription factor SPT20
MASAPVVARPTQALRQRRVSERPGIARVNTRATTVEAVDIAAPPLPMPYVRDSKYVLRKFDGKPPSLVIQLHQNHWKFLLQDGTFQYNSPMQFFLRHLRQQTLPHEMLEELHQNDVAFYDGCLIVEVQDFRSGSGNRSNTTTNVGGTDDTPCSVHNWNEHITPSPFVPFPDKIQMSPGSIKKEAAEGAPGDKVADKENMPAPDQPASASQRRPRPNKVFTTVMFPTVQSFEEDKNILAKTPLHDIRMTQRILQSKSRDGVTPALTHPPTPLTSVPSTPLTAKATHKKQRMALDENNVHDFEAQVLLATEPVLYLKPALDAYESDNIIASLAHPLHSGAPPAPKTRKRTTAELAADEAQAAGEERFMLSYDERHQQTSGHAAAGEGQTVATSLEPSFKRFKTLETIKSRHTEVEREKKEALAREAHLKKQQADADAQKRREQEKMMEEQRRMHLQQQQMMERQKQAQLQQAQQAQQAQAAQQAAQAAQVQAQQQAAHLQQQQHTPVTSHPGQMVPTAAQVQMSQAPAMSPVIRQGTPHSASSPMLRGGETMGMTSVPMAATASSQGAGSPPRPPSAISHHPMARQVSQQHAQVGSTQGTPQMASTPRMGSSQPNRMMTPAPRVTQHGSPVPGGIQGTPMMQTTSFTGMTPEMQRHAMLQAQQLQRQQMLQQQNQQNMGNMAMSPQQQMQLMQQRAQAQAQQQMGMGTPGQQHPQTMQNQQAILQRQMQIQQQQKQMMAAGLQPGQNMNMMTVQGQMGGNMEVQNVPDNSPKGLTMRWREAQMRNMQMQLQNERQKFIAQYGGNPPPQAMQQNDAMLQQKKSLYASQLQQQLPRKMAEFTTQLQQRQNGMQQGMAQQGNPMAAQMGQNPTGQQYMNSLQQQRLRMMQLQQQQRQQQQNMMAQQGMQNMQGMNMQQLQQLQQQMGMQNVNMNNMNMQGMGGMSMPGQMGGQGMGM